MSGHSLRMACEQSRRDLAASGIDDDRHEVHRLVAAGKWVLFDRGCIHCRFTDAVIGEAWSIVKVFDSHEELLAYGNAHCDDYENLDYLGNYPPEPEPVLDLEDDDVPF